MVPELALSILSTTTMVGDSITVDAAPYLEECGIEVDAFGGRAHNGSLYDPFGLKPETTGGAVERIEMHRDHTDEWIIGIGTNDMGSLAGNGLFDARDRIEHVIEATQADREDITFVWTDVHGDPSLEARSIVWNVALQMTPGVNVIQWSQSPELMRDAVHHTPDGAREFANTICEYKEAL